MTSSRARQGLGCMLQPHSDRSIGGGYATADDEASKATLGRALELGDTFWDTADSYGPERSERIIGEVLRETGARNQVFLCSKFGFCYEDGKLTGAVRGDRQYVIDSLEATTKRLGSAPDLYYQHRVDPAVPIEETFTTLEELRLAGKIKHIGMSECSIESMRKAIKVAKVEYLQIELSPWTRDVMTNGMLECARELGMTVVAYSPLGRGYLTGAITSPILDGGDARSRHPRFAAEHFQRNQQLVADIRRLAERKGCTASQWCIAWVAAQGEDTIPLPADKRTGTKSVRYLEENWAARNVSLSQTELEEAKSMLDAVQVGGSRYSEQMLAGCEL